MKTNTLVHPANISYAYDVYDVLIKEVKAPPEHKITFINYLISEKNRVSQRYKVEGFLGFVGQCHFASDLSAHVDYNKYDYTPDEQEELNNIVKHVNLLIRIKHRGMQCKVCAHPDDSVVLETALSDNSILESPSCSVDTTL